MTFPFSSTMTTAPRAQWTSMFSYLLVTTGTVIGLGNIFRFPYFVAKYGSIFIICYILFELLISIPIFLAEAMIGRRGKQNPVGSIGIITMEMDASRYWRIIGWLCLVILFLTLCFYSVQVSFPLTFFVNAISNTFNHETITTAVNTVAATTSAPTHAITVTPAHIVSLVIFLAATFIVIGRGINRGVEGISRLVIPFFFLSFLGLAIYACSIGNFSGALANLFDFNLQHVDLNLLFIAFTYAFFKINVGMGTMIVYGSYLPITAPLGKSTMLVVLFDAIASLLAYFVIYPIVLSGPTTTVLTSLQYQIIPNIFAQVPGGGKMAFIFFLATILTAWMPTIAFAESVTLTLIERFHLSRRKATMIIAATALIIAFAVMMSYGQWAEIKIFSKWTIDGGIQELAGNILTPLSAFLIAIFAGWIVEKQISGDELGFQATTFRIWYFLIRYIAPVLCGTLFVLNVLRAFSDISI
jgi:neurotransmitter:Na+ symporter, NSS family